MKFLSRSEGFLLIAFLAAVALASWGPNLAQAVQYHDFADQHRWLGVPNATDVLTNLAFAVAGFWGLMKLWWFSCEHDLDARWQMSALFFIGLLLTAVGSTYYHWRPNDFGLAWDRLGMVVAFAGLLGMAVADRISVRSGVVTMVLTLSLGSLSVLAWYQTGDLLPWVILQGGGMLLVLVLASLKPLPGGWGLPLLAVVTWYIVAKLFELGDHAVYAWTGELVSGHSLKHVAAALATLPILEVMHNSAQASPMQQIKLQIQV